MKPQMNTYYVGQGIMGWGIEFLRPDLKENALKDFTHCGLYEEVDFYEDTPGRLVLKVKLTAKGKRYFTELEQPRDIKKPYDRHKFSKEWKKLPKTNKTK